MADDNKNENRAVREDLDEQKAAEGQSGEDSPAVSSPDVAVDSANRLAELEKEHLYLRAELENVKRQNIKERSQLIKYGAERLARDLLDTLDIFRSAMATAVNAENFQDFVKGVEMTNQSLRAALEKHGITEVACIGQPFDPNTQEAISSEPSDQYPEGHVTQVFKPPYTYHDKLLRPGLVVVSRAKTE